MQFPHKDTVWKVIFPISFLLFLYWPIVSFMEGDYISGYWVLGLGSILYGGSYSLLRLEDKKQVLYGLIIAVITAAITFFLAAFSDYAPGLLESLLILSPPILLSTASYLRFVQKWGAQTSLLILLAIVIIGVMIST